MGGVLVLGDWLLEGEPFLGGKVWVHVGDDRFFLDVEVSLGHGGYGGDGWAGGYFGIHVIVFVEFVNI